MRYRATSRRPRSVAGSLVVLLIVAVAAVEISGLVWPRLRHALRGTLIGDSSNVGPPVVCRSGNVLAGVYNPARLGVLAPCVTAFGRVTFILHAPDGDIHINLLPDRGYWHLLYRRNFTRVGGALVVEIVPADRATVPIPALGAHVRVTGAYVVDHEHDWAEIHPAWQIVGV